jgi:hypothetical protein
MNATAQWILLSSFLLALTGVILFIEEPCTNHVYAILLGALGFFSGLLIEYLDIKKTYKR